jgi:hypothetical protein
MRCSVPRQRDADNDDIDVNPTSQWSLETSQGHTWNISLSENRLNGCPRHTISAIIASRWFRKGLRKLALKLPRQMQILACSFSRSIVAFPEIRSFGRNLAWNGNKGLILEWFPNQSIMSCKEFVWILGIPSEIRNDDSWRGRGECPGCLRQYSQHGRLIRVINGWYARLQLIWILIPRWTILSLSDILLQPREKLQGLEISWLWRPAWCSQFEGKPITLLEIGRNLRTATGQLVYHTLTGHASR